MLSDHPAPPRIRVIRRRPHRLEASSEPCRPGPRRPYHPIGGPTSMKAARSSVARASSPGAPSSSGSRARRATPVAAPETSLLRSSEEPLRRDRAAARGTRRGRSRSGVLDGGAKGCDDRSRRWARSARPTSGC
jgi:hypothetical protein